MCRHTCHYGALANHIWSYEGWGNNEVNATFLQPFVSYTAKTFTTFGVQTESTYDWSNHQWTVPVIGQVSQPLKIGNQPVQFSIGAKYYADKPDGGPDWGLALRCYPPLSEMIQNPTAANRTTERNFDQASMPLSANKSSITN